jgi:hypothetical protein
MNWAVAQKETAEGGTVFSLFRDLNLRIAVAWLRCEDTAIRIVPAVYSHNHPKRRLPVGRKGVPHQLPELSFVVTAGSVSYPQGAHSGGGRNLSPVRKWEKCPLLGQINNLQGKHGL